MKNFLFTILNLLILMNLSFAAHREAFLDDIEREISTASFPNNWSTLTEAEVFKNAAGQTRALGVRMRKSTSASKKYPDGIYQIQVLASAKDSDLYFRDYEQLNKKSALFHLSFSERCSECVVTLPTMDTFVESGNFLNSRISIGTRGQRNNQNYYFKNQAGIKISMRAQGNVYALNPKDIEPFRDSDVEVIRRLRENRFKNFIKEHTDQFGAITYDDNHHRKARAIQIDQIVEYATAHNKGVKYVTFSAPTGSGKSYTMARIAELHSPKKVLFVTSRKNLGKQMGDEFKKHFPNLSFLIHDNSENFHQFIANNAPRKDVLISTIQSLTLHYKNDNLLSHFDVIMFDEAHNLLSGKRSQMVSHIKSNYPELELLFFTATPTYLVKRGDSKLISVYELSEEPVNGPYHVKPKSIADAISTKVNAPFQISYITGTNLDLKVKSNFDLGIIKALRDFVSTGQNRRPTKKISP